MDNMILNHPQCQYFVVRKKRLCRMTVRPGRDYCGEHEPQPRNEKGKDDTRIPCPYDPKHTCYTSKLPKHLAVCNARRVAEPAYIVRGVNAPACAAAPRPPRPPLARVPPHKILALIDKVNILYDKHVKGTIGEVAERPIHSAVEADFLQAGRAESSRRHLRQASSLLHLLEAEGLVRDNTCYVELGAGKGHLSYYAYRAWCGAGGGAGGGARVLLVDRASLRHKRDNKLRPPLAPATVASTESNASSADASATSTDGNDTSADCNATSGNGNDTAADAPATSTSALASPGVAPTTTESHPADVAGCFRIRADLAHLVLDAVPQVAQSEAVVGFAKHLCGVATEYAVRCVCASERARGLALATCCHHRCEPAALRATTHLQEMGISEEELDILLGVVSWATCGGGGGAGRGPAAERARAGRRAKALLDQARVLFLRARGFRARLVRYVAPRVSPENLCIVAARD